MSEADRQPPTIPGYTLTTRLGAGGYGEVWLAHAPGGLNKAVKIIYGSFNDRRAELELRSLHRIKSVRHPFLLSLERIEIVDNRLAIVTELADSSLKDRYDECRRSGLSGIARDELLGYMRDAADALDFLGDRHSLQHLDVKPENLLLVGGHIKVADFGLVKEVGRTQASLVGGLTPLYSSPEVFQGTPGARSDQYSLAVVYQEMLTGVAPFAGASAAELTVQHLQGEPNLAPLPMSDRFVIARALAKDPKQRYATCTQMVEALLAAEVERHTDQQVAESSRSFDDLEPAFHDGLSQPGPGPAAEFLGERGLPEKGGSRANVWMEPEQADLATQRSIDLSALPGLASTQPSVVIGVGGLAGRVLRQLRRRLVRELGDAGREAAQMLLVDTDPRGISVALQGNERVALRPDETLAAPLRRPQEYREDSALLMRWLSRRWLFNIPKSLQTEGLRPLGRLAFVDHSRQIGDRVVAKLRRAKSAADDVQGEALATKQQPLKVYVVAGVAGGTGGGMSLDLGYAIRHLAAKADLGEVEVVGLFLHATGRDARQNELARVNSFAWLSEYNHYHREPGAYPGDEGCGLPASPASTKAFDSAYFVDLGAAVDDEALDAVASEAAEYLYLDVATPVSEFFAACRKESHAGDYAPLRSFKLKAAAAADDRAIEAAANMISRAVLIEWLGCGPKPTGSTPAAEPIDLAALANRTREAIVQTLAAEPNAADQTTFQLATLVRTIDDAFAAPDDRPGTFVLGRSLEEVVADITGEMAAKMTAAILRLVDQRGVRLAGASALVDASRVQFLQLDAEATRLAAGIAQQAAAAKSQIERWQRERSAPNLERERQFGEAYRQLRIDQYAMTAVACIAKRLLAELRTINDRLGEISRQLKGLLQQFPQDLAVCGVDPFATAVAGKLSQLVDLVDAQVEQGYATPAGGLLAVAMGSPRVRDQLTAEMLRLATHLAEEVAVEPALLSCVATPSHSADGESAATASHGSELPPLSCLGGAYARLEATPKSSSGAATWQSTDGVAVLSGVGSQLVHCCEVWNLSLPRIAMNLIGRRPEYIELADRVRSRCDVDWTPLGQQVAAPAIEWPVNSLVASPDAVTMTQLL